MPNFTSEALIKAGTEIFIAAGTPPENARIVAELVAEANSTGHDSHGVIRIPQYLSNIEAGEIIADAAIEIVRENPITAVIDGHRGFGQVTMSQAVDVALEKAGQHGLSAVSVRGANHIGRLGSYVDHIAKQGMIGLLFVNAIGIPSFRMAPWGGTEPRLATDPLAIGIPTSSGEPIVMDMTSTVVAEGKVRLKRNRGEETPDGWLLDAEGNPTNDPNVLYGEPPGSILPLGGTTAGHKGYGLNVAIELLAGILSGTGCIDKTGEPLSNGVLLLVIDIEQFLPLDDYLKEADTFIAHVKSSPPAAGVEEIFLPGEIELRVKQQRAKDGIFVEDETWQQVVEWGQTLGIDLSDL